MASRTISASDRAAIEASAERRLSELSRHFEEVARDRGREVDLPEPLFFADLLRILQDLEVQPTDFFHQVIRRWG